MSNIDDYFIPDQRQDIADLPATATQADILERINLLSALVNQLLKDNIGDDGEEPEARRR